MPQLKPSWGAEQQEQGHFRVTLRAWGSYEAFCLPWPDWKRRTDPGRTSSSSPNQGLFLPPPLASSYPLPHLGFS